MNSFRMARVAIILGVFFLLALPVTAQRGGGISGGGSLPAGWYNRSYALVVGIDSYSSGWPHLRHAVNDARKMAERWRRYRLLPDAETLDKLGRYETTLERSLFRTIHELRRLQAAREGEPLLPPAAVDVDLST